MKLDLMVYGRGVERLDGYQQFAAPPYWTEDMLMAMDQFNDLWVRGDLSDSLPEIYAADQNPWANSYMFICMPPPYCCALLRCTRVEGDKPGTWLKEARNYDVWSMEGWCCPYEQRDRFFVLLPSLLLWMRKDSTSLYGRLRSGRIGTSVELPDTIVYNPLLNERPPAELLSLMPDAMSQNALVTLNNRIHQSSYPFQFMFGPLADYFNAVVGAHYGIQEVFSTIHQSEMTEHPDPFQNIEYITLCQSVREIHPCNLRLYYTMSGRGEEYRYWGIHDEKTDAENDCFLKSRLIQTNADTKIYMADLLAEAEIIRNLAKQMHWEIYNDMQESHRYYTFGKEA